MVVLSTYIVEVGGKIHVEDVDSAVLYGLPAIISLERIGARDSLERKI